MSTRTPSPPLNYDYSLITADTDPAAILLLDAKTEYHKQLSNHIRQPVFNLMKSIYNTAENICHQENTPENILMVFQDNLAQVPKWTKTRRTKEYDEFLKTSKCDWFNELIKFTYVTHVKILTLVNKPRPNVKLSISIPSGGAFYHSVCINIARELWRQPYLFSKHVGGKYEYQKNMRQIEQLIDNSVDATIRAHIPMKTIFEDYLDNNIAVADKPSTVVGTNPVSNKSRIETQPEKLPDPQQPISVPTENNAQIPDKLNTTKKQPLQINTDESLDEFIDTPSQILPNPESTDNLDNTNPMLGDETDLEPVSFTKPAEMEEELEIIEPPMDDLSAISLDDGAIPDLSEVIIPSPAEKPASPSLDKQITTTSNITNNTNTQLEPSEWNQNSLSNNTIHSNEPSESHLPSEPTLIPANNHPSKDAEFDIDSLPEISINNPVLPTPTRVDDLPASTSQQPAITDLNEPGMNLLPEVKQPSIKKKIVIEDLPIEDLDEINLDSKLEEQRTIKYSAAGLNTSKNNTAQTKNIKTEFAFF